MVNNPFSTPAVENSGLEHGLCRDPQWFGGPGVPTPWETVGSQPWHEQLLRFDQASQLCLQCPALAACTAYADDMQRQGWDIDGVVAGRIPAFQGRRRCHRCHRYFLHENSTVAATDVAVREYRRGLCRNCYRIEVVEPAQKKRRKKKKKGR